MSLLQTAICGSDTSPTTIHSRVEPRAFPVLALTGEKDLQVDQVQNLPEIEKALRSGGLV